MPSAPARCRPGSTSPARRPGAPATGSRPRPRPASRSPRSSRPRCWCACGRANSDGGEVNLVTAPRQTRLRRDLALIRADGVFFSLMVGLGETYLAAFALALGNSDVAAGLLSALPMLAGGILQLIAPSAMHRASSYRSWVKMWAALQAASFLPLVVAAWLGAAPVALLFACAFIYWGSGLATAPAWNAWMAQIVPARIRSRYFGSRQSAAQLGVLAGLVAGGLMLHHSGRDTRAFAILFAAAFLCRA